MDNSLSELNGHVEHLSQTDVDRRLALYWMLHPESAPLSSLDEEVQRLVAVLNTHLPLPGGDAETRRLIEAREREQRELEEARRLASLNRARQLSLTISDELEQQTAEERVQAFLAEMLTSDQLDGIPDLEPVVEGLLYRGTVARMNGKPGAMKSFVALDMAGHVACGLAWNGMPVTAGAVVYLVAEGHGGIRKRVRAWEQTTGRKMQDVLFLPRPVQVGGPEWLVLQEACKTLTPALVIVDTQARATVGVDESSNERMSVIFDRVERLARESTACTLLIHHTGHTGDHGRGASNMLGAVQTEITVKKEGKGPDKVIVITGDKSKDDDDDYKIRMLPRVVAVDGMAKRSGAPETSVVLVPEAQAVLCLPGLTVEATAAVQLLDKYEAPTDIGRDAMRRWLNKEEIVAPGNTPLAAAIRYRKQRDQLDVPDPIPDPELFEDLS